MNKREMNEVYNLRQEIKSIERIMRTLPSSERLNELCTKYEYLCGKFRDVVERCEQEIQKLPNSRLRCAFRMRYLEGMTWQEIADEMGGHATIDSVKKMVYRQFNERRNENDTNGQR